MKTIATIAIICGIGLVLWGTAVLTAARRPPEWMFWSWDIAGRQVSVNRYALWWFTPDKDGAWSTDIVFWRPRIQYKYISTEAANMLKDKRVWSVEPTFDPAVSAQYESLKARDDKKFWVWPDWYGLLKPDH